MQRVASQVTVSSSAKMEMCGCSSLSLAHSTEVDKEELLSYKQRHARRDEVPQVKIAKEKKQ